MPMPMAAPLTKEQRAKRFLTAIYRLANGVAGVNIVLEDAVKEANRVKLYEMSDEEFAGYHRGCVFRAREAKS